MSQSCCEIPNSEMKDESKTFRNVLWIALVLNACMFGIEAYSSFHANSVSLLADAVDFLGDAGNYAISLIVLPLAAHWRSKAAFFKGATMFSYGLFVFGRAAWLAFTGSMPEATVMGVIGTAALIVNLFVAILLFKFREGDANQKSVWICSRNDAIGNVSVLGAALLVGITKSNWPDLLVALGMAFLALKGGYFVIAESRKELRDLESGITPSMVPK